MTTKEDRRGKFERTELHLTRTKRTKAANKIERLEARLEEAKKEHLQLIWKVEELEAEEA